MKLLALDAAARQDWFDPAFGGWGGVESERIDLAPSPVGMAPAPYIRDAYDQPKKPSVPWCELRAGVSEDRVLAHLTWPDPNRDDAIVDATRFVDAAAIAFAPDERVPLFTMGDARHAISAVLWRASATEPLIVTARGLGTTRREPAVDAQHRSAHDGRRWRIVLSLPNDLAGREGPLPLAAGDAGVFAVAIWEGSHRERAGLKSFSPGWRPWNVDA